jgi:hypothetical protein
MEINKALLCDAVLREQYAELSSVIHEIDRVTVDPPASAVLNILAYSRSLKRINQNSHDLAPPS